MIFEINEMKAMAFDELFKKASSEEEIDEVLTDMITSELLSYGYLFEDLIAEKEEKNGK